MALNLNVSPYFDDFDSTKNYNRILFKPGAAVQARELTQIQTAIQDQLGLLGNFVLQDGAIITGGIEKTIPTYFIKVTDSDYDGYAITNSSLANYVNKTVVGATSGLRAKILDYAEGSSSESPNLKTLYIEYTNQALISGYEHFTAGEKLTVVDGQLTKDDTFVVDSTNNTLLSDKYFGITSLLQLSPAIIYAGGSFIRTPTLSAYIDRYSLAKRKKIGFVVNDTIVQSGDDETLLDPASGSYNYNAPGADRLQKVVTLKTYDSDSDIPDNFYQYALWEYGVISRADYKTDPLAGIKDSFSRRAYDTNGDYVVSGLKVSLREHLLSGYNGGKFTAAQGGDENYLAIAISAGKGVVKGDTVELKSDYYIKIPKSTDTNTVTNYSTNTFYGNYVYVTEIAGLWDVDGGTEIALYDTAQTANSGSGFSSTSVSGTKIGTAKIRHLAYHSGTPGDDSAVYKAYLYDIKMWGGGFEAVKSLYYDRASGTKGFADTVLEVTNKNTVEWDNSTYYPPNQVVSANNKLYTVVIAGISSASTAPSHSSGTATNGTITFQYAGVATYGSVLKESNYNKLIWTLPKKAIKSLKTGTSPAYDYTFKYQKEFDTTLDANASLIVSLTGNETFPFGAGSLGASEITANVHVVASDSFSLGGGASFADGEYIDLTSGTRSVTQTSSTSLSIDLDDTIDLGTYPNTSVRVYVTVQVSNANPITKAFFNNGIVRLDASSNPYTSNTKVFSLGISDVLRINSITATSNADYTTSAIDVTNQFLFENGQNDNYYGHASIRLKPTSTLDLATYPYIKVTFDTFTRSVSGPSFATIDSYQPMIDANDIEVQEIPIYLSSRFGALDLRSCIDFRPYIQNTATTTAVLASSSINPSNTQVIERPSDGLTIPDPQQEFLTDFEYYLGKSYLVGITSDGFLEAVPGPSAEVAFFPDTPAGFLTLAKLKLQPYPSLTSVSAKIYQRKDLAPILENINNRRYTMKDIRGLEKRIENLEYYVALTSLQQQVLDKKVYNSTGVDRFKNGIFVDSFTDNGNINFFNPETNCALDERNASLIPSFSSETIALKPLSAASGTTAGQHGDMFHVPYVSVLYSEQIGASRQRIVAGDFWAPEEEPVIPAAINTSTPAVVNEPTTPPTTTTTTPDNVSTETGGAEIPLPVSQNNTPAYSFTYNPGLGKTFNAGRTATLQIGSQYVVPADADTNVVDNGAYSVTYSIGGTLASALATSNTSLSNGIRTNATSGTMYLNRNGNASISVSTDGLSLAGGTYTLTITIGATDSLGNSTGGTTASWSVYQVDIIADPEDQPVVDPIVEPKRAINLNVSLSPSGDSGIDKNPALLTSDITVSKFPNPTDNPDYFYVSSTSWINTEIKDDSGKDWAQLELDAEVKSLSLIPGSEGNVTPIGQRITDYYVDGNPEWGYKVETLSLKQNLLQYEGTSVNIDDPEQWSGFRLYEYCREQPVTITVTGGTPNAQIILDCAGVAEKTITLDSSGSGSLTVTIPPNTVPQGAAYVNAYSVETMSNGLPWCSGSAVFQSEVGFYTNRQTTKWVAPLNMTTRTTTVLEKTDNYAPYSLKEGKTTTTYYTTTFAPVTGSSSSSSNSVDTTTTVINANLTTDSYNPIPEDLVTVVSTTSVNQSGQNVVEKALNGGGSNVLNNAVITTKTGGDTTNDTSGGLSVDLGGTSNNSNNDREQVDTIIVAAANAGIVIKDEKLTDQLGTDIYVRTGELSAEAEESLQDAYDMAFLAAYAMGGSIGCPWGWDPTAQTFKVEGMPGGMFVPEVDIFFSAKPDGNNNNGITLELRETINAAPGPNVYARVHKKVTDIDISYTNESGQVSFRGTTFVFDYPVHLENDREYCIVLIPDNNDPGYKVWTSRLGEIDKVSGNKIFKQPHSGILFTSSNNRGWVPHQDEDLMFRVKRCHFQANTDYTVVTTNKDYDWIDFEDFSTGTSFTLNGSNIYGWTITIDEAGAGYVSTPTIVVDNTGTNGTGFAATAVLTGDVVTSIIVTNPGYGYVTPPVLSFSGGTPTTAAEASMTMNIGRMKYHTHDDIYTMEVKQGYFAVGMVVGDNERSATVANIYNKIVDAYMPQNSTISPRGTLKLDTKVGFTNSTGVSSGNTSVTLTKPWVLTTDFTTTQKAVYSYSNEQAVLGGDKSLRMTFTLSTEYNNVSPMVDMFKTDLLTVGYNINNVYTNETGIYGDATSKYISKRVNLSEGQDAEDLKVWLDEKLPVGASVKVYAKLRNSEDDGKFVEELGWVELILDSEPASLVDNFGEYAYVMPDKGVNNIGLNDEGILEYDVTRVTSMGTISSGGSGYSSAPTVVITDMAGGQGLEAKAIISGGSVVAVEIVNPGRDFTGTPTYTFDGGSPSVAATPGTVTTATTTYTSFKDFAIKIVMLSDKTCTPPRCRNLRAIALQA